MHRSFTYLVKVMPKYFIIFNSIVNGIVSFISFSDSSLLLYKNVADFWVCWFCILHLY